jgi:hypothetical protein
MRRDRRDKVLTRRPYPRGRHRLQARACVRCARRESTSLTGVCRTCFLRSAALVQARALARCIRTGDNSGATVYAIGVAVILCLPRVGPTRPTESEVALAIRALSQLVSEQGATPAE